MLFRGLRGGEGMSKRLSNLDGLRGIAALSVVFHHFGKETAPYWFWYGQLSVYLFFILSGYVIARRYEASFQHGMQLSLFLRMRAQKLMPVYWMGCLCCVIIFFVFGHENVALTHPVARYVFFLFAAAPLFSSSMFPINPPAWTFFIELVANAVYAGGMHKFRTGVLFGLSLFSFILSTIFSMYSEHINFITNVVSGVACFLIGVCLYRVREDFTGYKKFHPMWCYVGWLILAFVPLMTHGKWYAYSVILIVCPFLVLILARSAQRAPKWCIMLGWLSYPLYTSHWSVILLYQRLSIQKFSWVTLVMCLCAVAALAWLIARANDCIQVWLHQKSSFRIPPVCAE